MQIREVVLSSHLCLSIMKVTSDDSDIGPEMFWHHHEIAQRVLYKDAPSLWVWGAKVCRFFTGDQTKEETAAEEAFLAFHLRNTARFCLGYLPVNILLLLGSVYIIAQEYPDGGNGTLDHSFRAFKPAIVGILIWIVLSGICIVYFAVYHFAPEMFGKFSLGSFSDVWYEIGATILLTRGIILVTQLTQAAQSGGQCLDAADLIGTTDSTYGYMFIKMSVDTYQTYVMALLPFPQPWALAIILVEYVRQMTRVFSCADRITTGPQQRWLVVVIATMSSYMYLFLMTIPSIYLEGSYRNRFRSEQLQRDADQGKREMVGFLSNDVRVPLQYMLHAVSSIDFVKIAGSNVQPLLSDIHRYSSMVNDTADELLLVVRIKEGRYTSRQTFVSDLQALLEDTIEAFKQRRFPQQNRRAAAVVSAAIQEVAIYTSAPAVAVHFDERCTLAALRYLLVFLVEELKSRAKAAVNTAGADTVPPPLSLHLTAELSKAAAPSSSSATDLGGKQHGELVLKVTGGVPLPCSTHDEARRMQEITTRYVCATIAAACSGTFTAKLDEYTLSVPCTYVEAQAPAQAPEAAPGLAPGHGGQVMPFESADGAESVGAGSVPRSVVSSERNAADVQKYDREVLESKIHLAADMQEHFKLNRVCAIVADPVLESVMTNAIKRMRLGDGLTVLHELQRGVYVPVAKLTFVTTFELCAELRAREYGGHIVLFSGSTSYLDDAQMANVDYCLPLPCSDRHMSRFIDWLVEIHALNVAHVAAEAEARAVAERRRHDGDMNIPASPLSSSKINLVRAVTTKLSLFEWTATSPRALRDVLTRLRTAVLSALRYCGDSLVSKDCWFFIRRLPPGTGWIYPQWKLLNPSGSWYHHSAQVFEMSSPFLVLSIIVQVMILGNPVTSIAAQLVVIPILMARGPIYQYIVKPCGFRFWKFWMIPSASIILFFIFTILQQPWDIADRRMTLGEFMNHDFNGHSGSELLLTQLMSATTMRPYSNWSHQPLNLLTLILVFVRACQSLWVVSKYIASVQFCEYTQMILLQAAIMNMAYMNHLDNCYREEFIISYEHILSKAFLEQCLEVCQQDIRRPLEFLLGRKDDLMQVLDRAALSPNFRVDRSLMERLEPLQVSHWLLAEVANEASYSTYLLPVEKDAAPVRHPMEPVQLSRKIAELVSAFSSSARNPSVSIEAEVDHALAVIRVDWRMLSVILTNLLSAALRSIQEESTESPHNKSTKSAVFLKFVAISTDAKVPFVAPRVMLINVLDSSGKALRLSQEQARRKEARASEAASFASDSTKINMFQYGRSMCARLVHKVVEETPLFQTIHCPESPLPTVQRFTFPYQLSSQTRRAAEYISEESHVPYITIRTEPTKYLSTYERVVRPTARTRNSRHGVMQREPGEKRIVLVTCVDPKAKADTMLLVGRLQEQGWVCALKYVLRIPSLRSIGDVDCVLLDQQLEIQEKVSICEIVLKLRVCGFSGVIAVVLQEGHRTTPSTQQDLSRSAAEVDLILTSPVSEQKVLALGATMERKCVKQVLNLNCA